MSISKVPSDLRYAKTHEWVRLSANVATIGITDHAQHELTDIVFVELPEVGRKIKAGDPCAVVESVKTASDIYARASVAAGVSPARMKVQPRTAASTEERSTTTRLLLRFRARVRGKALRSAARPPPRKNFASSRGSSGSPTTRDRGKLPGHV